MTGAATATGSGGFRRFLGAFGRVVMHGAYRPEVDGLRFFAIAFVIFGHLMERVVTASAGIRPLTPADRAAAHWVPAAQTGVLLFFAISGYILAAQFRRRWSRGERVAYGDYLQRRALRIAPPYLLVLIAGNLALAVKPSLASGAVGPLLPHLAASIAYLHGLVFGALPQGFAPGWSLEIEVHFYLVAPLLFLAYFRLRGEHRAFAAGLATTVLIVAWMYAAQALFGEYARFYFALPKFIGFFWIGLWLADLFPNAVPEGRPTRGLDIMGFAALAGLAAAGIAANLAWAWAGAATVEAARMLLILLVFVAAIRGGAFRRFCSARWLAFLGSACYSFYLVHLQIMQVMTAPIVRLAGGSLWGGYALALAIELPVMLGVGLCFYLLIERPFQRGNPFGSFRLRRPPAAPLGG